VISLQQLERLALLATRGLSLAGLIALMLLAAMTLADGTLRWLANRPIEGVRDVGAAVIAVAVSCCFPAGLMERAHITIRVAGTLLGSKFGLILDALAAVAVWVVAIAMAWQFTVFAGKIAHAHETTWVLKIPTAPFWYTVAVILWIAVLVQSIVVILQISKAR
jgi:TRAP-type C4-dicarboxylate transport system permease small subunit